ncbi:hypothetical protein [Bradyrhizobium sp. AUGA SZCCT0169]|nr:hypothetical protein [Bradyrhizobium sp. AUGA SZCCT0169]
METPFPEGHAAAKEIFDLVSSSPDEDSGKTGNIAPRFSKR